jgi:hypothetical protein
MASPSDLVRVTNWPDDTPSRLSLVHAVYHDVPGDPRLPMWDRTSAHKTGGPSEAEATVAAAAGGAAVAGARVSELRPGVSEGAGEATCL